MFINYQNLQISKDKISETINALQLIKECLYRETIKLKAIDEAEEIYLRLKAIDDKIERILTLNSKLNLALDKLSDNYKSTERMVSQQIDCGTIVEKQAFTEFTNFEDNVVMNWEIE